jgi:hypothetical protein
MSYPGILRWSMSFMGGMNSHLYYVSKLSLWTGKYDHTIWCVLKIKKGSLYALIKNREGIQPSPYKIFFN